MKVWGFVILFAVLTTSTLAFNTTTYKTCQNLNADYVLCWNVEGDRIRIGLDVKTQGWIGFGIGEPTSGSMPGADIVIASKEGLSDRYALAKATPLVDDCQDWTLISMERTSQGTMVEMSRTLLVNNTQDRSIVSGANRVIFSYGDSDTFQYHGANRGATVISFYGAPIPTLPNLPSWTLLSTNFTIPAQVTTYAFTSFVLPTQGGPYHMVAFEPIVDNAAVHHFILHYCPTPTTWFNSFLNKTKQGTAGTEGYCIGQTWGWAPGMGSLVLPDDVGFRVGNSADDYKYLTLEIHLNNPTSSSTLGKIQSGVRIYYTNTLRKYDAAVLALGDPYVFTPSSIPPGQEKYEIEYQCTEGATSKLNSSIHVFASNIHMHATGRQMWTTHWRNSAKISETNRVDFFSYDFQQSTPVNFDILPGDRLNTHCVFDTRTRTGVTKFGAGSSDEMCIEFLAYYPRISGTPAACGFGYSSQYNLNVTVWGEEPITFPNPSVRDPPGGDKISFGTATGTCATTGTGTAGNTNTNTETENTNTGTGTGANPTGTDSSREDLGDETQNGVGMMMPALIAIVVSMMMTC